MISRRSAETPLRGLLLSFVLVLFLIFPGLATTETIPSEESEAATNTALAAAPAAASAAAAPEASLVASADGITGLSGKHFLLPNGLNVFIKEVKAAPVVAFNVWVKVGSRNEKPGEEGFSHFLEHMMFKGTPTYPTGQLDKEIKKLGATQNAFTSLDYTCFYLVGAAQHYARLVELEADAVFHSLIDPQEYAKEREVVVEELRMGKDNPMSVAREQLSAEAFRVHTYRNPVIGYEHVLRAATASDLHGFYKRHYVPSNMWVVVVGDVKTEEALEVVKKHFGDQPKVEPPEKNIPQEPPQTAGKEVRQYGPINQAYVFMGWHAPGIESPDNYTLDVISEVMGSGRSSRLYRQLVEEERLATSVSCGYYTAADPYLLTVFGNMPQGNVRRFIERVKQIMGEAREPQSTGTEKGTEKGVGITPNELLKAKQAMAAKNIFYMETAENQASTYGHYAALGKLELSESYIDRVKEVSLEDIQRVAREVVNDRKLTVSRYEPAIATTTTLPEMITLENGLKLILKEDHSSPIVAISVQVDAGSQRDSKNENGLAQLTATMLQKGTKKRTSQQIADEFERMGTSFGADCSRSYASLQLTALSEKFLPSLDLLLDLIENPEFPEEEFRKDQERTLERIKIALDNLIQVTIWNTIAALFPDHPFGFPTLGTAERVKSLRRNDLVQFHKKHYIGGGMVVAVVGDFFSVEMKEQLMKRFSGIKEGNPGATKEIKEAKFPQPEVVSRLNREQVQVLFATRTFPRSDPRGPAIDILSNILSGSMNSRLFIRLRSKESLAYSVWGTNVAGKDSGYFLATLSSAVNKLDQAKKRLVEELAAIRTGGFTDEEFADAKSYIIGQYALSLVGNQNMANTLASDEYLGVGYDYFTKYPERISATTPDEVRKVAEAFMAVPETYLIGITQP